MSEKRRIKRGLWSIVIIAVSLLVLGTAGWYFAASKLEEQLAVIKSDQSRKGREISCANQDVRGYPFRLGVFCDGLTVRDVGAGAVLKTGPLRTAAQVYKPNTVISELVSPLSIQIVEGDIAATWNLMRSSLVIGLNGPKRYSSEFRDVSVILQKAPGLNLPEPLQRIKVVSGEAHARTVGEDNLDLALMMLGLEFNKSDSGKLIPAINLEIDTQLEAVISAMKRGKSIKRIAQDSKLSGLMRNLKVTLAGGGSVAMSGPFEIDKKGRFSGDVKVSVEELANILRQLKRTFPKAERALDQANLALSAFTGGGSGDFQVNVRKGNINLGLFPVGKIPPLF